MKNDNCNIDGKFDKKNIFTGYFFERTDFKILLAQLEVAVGIMK